MRRVFIPKPDGRQRPLGIPRVKDRVAQAAVKVVIEPLFAASFRPGSFGFRPKRGARGAVSEIRKWVTWGRDEVIDLDLKSYFDTIDHELLMTLARRRVSDPRVLRLIRLWLRAGVMHEGRREETLVGKPQGGVISPLANIYLHPLDVFWEREMKATTMVRYADDLVVLCPKGQARHALVVRRRFLGRLKLTGQRGEDAHDDGAGRIRLPGHPLSEAADPAGSQTKQLLRLFTALITRAGLYRLYGTVAYAR